MGFGKGMLIGGFALGRRLGTKKHVLVFLGLEDCINGIDGRHINRAGGQALIQISIVGRIGF
jgi:hypothetical protein